MAGRNDDIQQLTEELEKLEKAMDPAEAAKSLRDYMDSKAEEDYLGGTKANTGVYEPLPSPGCGCTVS